MGTTRRQHSTAFKAKVAIEALKERETLSELSTRFGVAQEMISRWKTEFIKSSSQIFDKKNHLSDEPTNEVKRLRSKVGELTMERDFFSRSLQTERSKSEIRRLVSKRKNALLSVRKQCEILQVSRSQVCRQPKGESEENLEIMRKMDEHHIEHPDEGVLGMRGMLRNNSYAINTKRVRRLMRLMNIKAIYPQKNLTKLAKGECVYPYLLRNLEVVRTNQVWSIDISYKAMAHGFMYITAIIDVYSRFIIGWHIGNSLDGLPHPHCRQS